MFKSFCFPKRFSIEQDLFEQYVQSLAIKAYLSEDYFIDIGIPEDYAKAQEDFKHE